MSEFAGRTDFDLHFRVFGIPVRVHPGFWVIAAILCWRSTAGDPGLVVTGIACIFLSVLVHELGHALAFRAFGCRSSIVLYFLGGYTQGGRLSTWKTVAVCAAGPAAGFALAGIVWAVCPDEPGHALPLLYAAWFLVIINVVWGVLNLVPCVPLDGGNIVAALVIRYWPHRAATTILKISIGSAGLAVLWGYSQGATFVMLMFAVLGVQHFMTLRAQAGIR